MDGQQWIWVALVLLGAAVAAGVMIFGRRRQKPMDGKRIAKHRERDAKRPGNDDDGKEKHPGPKTGV